MENGIEFYHDFYLVSKTLLVIQTRSQTEFGNEGDTFHTLCEHWNEEIFLCDIFAASRLCVSVLVYSKYGSNFSPK